MRPWLFGAGVTVVTLAIVVATCVAGSHLWKVGQQRQAAEAREALFPDVERPELRDASPVSAFGPTWEPGEDTYIMAMPLWPFAFRTPRDWNCYSGFSFDAAPLAPFAGCTAGFDLDTPPRMQVLVWSAQPPARPRSSRR